MKKAEDVGAGLPEPVATRAFKRAMIRQLVSHAGATKRSLPSKARGMAKGSRPAKRHRGPGSKAGGHHPRKKEG